MSRRAEAWAALQAALTTTDPACKDDERFTSDQRAAVEHAELRMICDGCAVLESCRTFVRSAPKNAVRGYWAGQVRTPRSEIEDIENTSQSRVSNPS